MSKTTITQLKKLPWNKASATFYVTKRRLVSRKAHYEVFQVDIDNKLSRRLISNARNKIDKSNTLKDYDFLTADQDQTLLTIEINDTDLAQIIDKIQAAVPPTKIITENDLIGSWSYIARIDFPQKQPLFTVRKVSDSWTTKRVKEKGALMFKKAILYDIGDKELFRIDSKIDFFSHIDDIFICDKKLFEAAMNFRAGMEKNRDNIVAEFSKLQIFKDASQVGSLVGDNLKRLRKLSQVNKSGYFRNSQFLADMQRISKIEQWTIKFDQNGQIVVDEDTIETVLTVLNNDRLKSPINKEGFDVDVKHKI